MTSVRSSSSRVEYAAGVDDFLPGALGPSPRRGRGSRCCSRRKAGWGPTLPEPAPLALALALAQVPALSLSREAGAEGGRTRGPRAYWRSRAWAVVEGRVRSVRVRRIAAVSSPASSSRTSSGRRGRHRSSYRAVLKVVSAGRWGDGSGRNQRRWDPDRFSCAFAEASSERGIGKSRVIYWGCGAQPGSPSRSNQ